MTAAGFQKKEEGEGEKGRADYKVQACGGLRVVGGERDLRLRADVSVDDDGCSLLKCRVVIMRDTCNLLTAHFSPVSACARVCVCVREREREKK